MLRLFQTVRWLVVVVFTSAILFSLSTIIASGTQFRRDHFQGLILGMDRSQVLSQLKIMGVSELEPQRLSDQDQEPITSADWLNLSSQSAGVSFSAHDVWRFHEPKGYSTVDLKFDHERLSAILYTWQPFDL
jgi:hypothetical protein